MPPAPSTAALRHLHIRASAYPPEGLYIWQLFNARYIEGDVLYPSEKEDFHKVSEDMEDYMASLSLKMLSGYLYRYYGKKVIILLDEYGTPMQEAYAGGYWEELTEFIRNLFHSTFKANPYLERAIMTGITRVGKESIFSDLNNLEAVTATSEKYETAFGFTEAEVFSALDEFGMADKKQDVRSWYDDFTFGKCTDIYNPWSIINYLAKRKLLPYWANTSSNGLAGKLIREGSKEQKQIFERLMCGENVYVEMDEQIVYNQLPAKKNAVWSLLLAGGYLKVIGMEYSEREGRYFYNLALTNNEAHVMFEAMIRDWFSSNDNYNDFLKALLANDIKAMNIYMNKVWKCSATLIQAKNLRRKSRSVFIIVLCSG